MSEVLKVVVPDIGDFDAVDVVELLVAPGDVVGIDDSLVTLESDKASMEVPSPVAGKVVELLVAIGDSVGEGAVLVHIEGSAAEADAAGPAEPTADASADDAPASVAAEEPAPEAETSEASAPRAPETSSTDTSQGGAPPAPEIPRRSPPPPADAGSRLEKRPHASPSVRRFARELGVDLTLVEGSARKGRIVKEDVERFVKRALAAATGAAAPGAGAGAAIPSVPAIDFSKFGPIEEKPLSRIRKLSAANLHRSWLNVPHVTQHDEADITELEAFRKAHKPEAERRGVKLTPLALILKATVAALRDFPEMNSSLSPDGESLVLKGYFHIGVAVDTPDGLVVPVIRDVDQKGIYELAGELGDVSSRAREKKLRPQDLSGASFTISSLGGIGGTAFTPIVNAPEVGILGVARSKMQPTWDGTQFVPRLILPLSLSYDHRVIDGAQAVRFTTHLSALLTDLRRVLL